MQIDRTKYMDSNEVKRLRQVTESWAVLDLQKGRITGPRVWLLIDIALSTGLRVGEIAAIQVKDIDLKRGCIKVKRLKKKKKVVESLAIGDELIKHIKTYLEGRESGPLFIGERGPSTKYGLQQAWKSAIRRAGLPKELSIHCARHTLAVHLLKKTGNLRQVQKQLGHSEPSTTANLYADVSFEDMQEGVNGLYQ